MSWVECLSIGKRWHSEGFESQCGCPWWKRKYLWFFQDNLHSLDENEPEGLPVLSGEDLLLRSEVATFKFSKGSKALLIWNDLPEERRQNHYFPLNYFLKPIFIDLLLCEVILVFPDFYSFHPAKSSYLFLISLMWCCSYCPLKLLFISFWITILFVLYLHTVEQDMIPCHLIWSNTIWTKNIQ